MKNLQQASLDELARFDAIIDTRSPAEFAEDHVPGALNFPVLDDAQRAAVGTLYKQVSPFDARKIGAAMVAENIARHLRASFHDKPRGWRPLIYCWRGGQRSGAMTLVLRQVGWDARQLEGGYKNYRRAVVDRLATLPDALQLIVIAGPTGSAKSRVLHALAARGRQVLDLEALAAHKGSVLGVLPDAGQPSQKSFESRLLAVIDSLDPARPVFVEAESRKIGRLQVPDALIAAMRRGRCVAIEAPVDARVRFLLRDYDYFLRDVDWLASRLEALRDLRGGDTVAGWIALARSGHWDQLVHTLLTQHYDPLYRKSQQHNYAGFAQPLVFPADELDTPGIDRLAAAIDLADGTGETQ